ncbi:hypothetical protein L2E82_05441 [Cichorium intybus]|uniref:Uncharacterized protein n=1 Tax=Cichorium intybus TaxID=13427 RepID=A0ACB9H783_CICIN|nr:hypothetical protein L2E82_05441 [Cichorium intybus]
MHRWIGKILYLCKNSEFCRRVQTADSRQQAVGSSQQTDRLLLLMTSDSRQQTADSKQTDRLLLLMTSDKQTADSRQQTDRLLLLMTSDIRKKADTVSKWIQVIKK